jgi:hypothetical protein
MGREAVLGVQNRAETANNAPTNCDPTITTVIAIEKERNSYDICVKKGPASLNLGT